ncbi:MAG: DUF4276 family protein [Desulfobacteraceae bacterium]|nr:DUF4276 family protein [Desulfobacteraceae bacterium]
MIIGVIAEDNSDIDVLYELTCKLTKENTFSFKSFNGHGSGMIRRKCTAWAKNLFQRGCSHLVVLHDLDEYKENELRLKLRACVHNVNFKGYVILIPVHELEAWLLADAKSLKEVFHMVKLPKLPRNPEAVKRPKEKLRDIIWKATNKYYVNTIHNKKIAAACRISKVKNCKSFCPYPKFITLHTSE